MCVPAAHGTPRPIAREKRNTMERRARARALAVLLCQHVTTYYTAVAGRAAPETISCVCRPPEEEEEDTRAPADDELVGVLSRRALRVMSIHAVCWIFSVVVLLPRGIPLWWR